jgi:hypothetical protein
MGEIELNIIEFKEGKFFFNKNIDYSEEVRKNIGIELRPELIYKHGSDVAFIRLACIYKNRDAVVMSYDMSLGFLIKDWSKSIAQMSEKKILSHGALSVMADILIGFFRGALAVHAKGSELENAFFPFLRTDEFVSNIHLRLVEEQKKED